MTLKQWWSASFRLPCSVNDAFDHVLKHFLQNIPRLVLNVLLSLLEVMGPRGVQIRSLRYFQRKRRHVGRTVGVIRVTPENRKRRWQDFETHSKGGVMVGVEVGIEGVEVGMVGIEGSSNCGRETSSRNQMLRSYSVLWLCIFSANQILCSISMWLLVLLSHVFEKIPAGSK